MSKIKVLQLVNNYTLISKIKEETETTFVCDNPHIVHPVRNAQGESAVQFIPFVPFLKDTSNVPVAKHQVVVSGEPNEELYTAYQQATTGLTLPPKGLIIS